MADLGWLRYAAPDQVPILRDMDRRARPWREVPDLVCCPACCGALPPDTEAACSVCGTGSWRPLAKPAPVLPERGVSSSWATFPNPPEERPALSGFERDAAALRGDWIRVGLPSTLAMVRDSPHWSVAPPEDVEDWENGDVVLTLKRRPWWLRWWNR